MRYITANTTPTPTLRGIADHSWQARALCRSIDPARADRLFFPTSRNRATVAEAKRLCNRCPVKKACFDYALDNEIRDGMWGGLTEAERRPWHARITKRLDYSRVKAVFQGRDVHLSEAEREAAIRHAYTRGWSPERLARTLQLNLDWARDLMRIAAHDVADRDRYWDLYDEAGQEESDAVDEPHLHEGEPPEGDDQGQGEAVSSPVPCHVQSHALIAALRRAA